MKFLTGRKHVNRCRIRQLLLMMKLVIILMTIGMLQVSAKGFAQKITMTKTNAPLSEVIKEIRKQSGYDFIYNLKLLEKSKPVTLKVKNGELKDVLNSIFNEQPLSYLIADKAVIVKEKESSLIEDLKEKVKETLNFFRADSVVFRGTVVDEKGLPMPGATVRVKGKKTATKSKEDGSYSILAPVKGALVISFIGYKDQEISLLGVDNGKPINVMMQIGQSDLDEVSIASNGYQNVPKERSTGSFEVITAKQLQHSNDPNLLRRLDGITTGVNFNNNEPSQNMQIYTNSAGSGQNPGNPRKSLLENITIRGKNTLPLTSGQGQVNPSGQPLVVIDGIASPYSVDNVNPNDVETVTLLKDAAAASIWGSRAANGVIVITTKRGKFDRPLSVNFNSNFNVTEKIDLFYNKYMSTSDLIDFQVQAYNNQYSPSNENAFYGDPTFTSRYTRRSSPVFEIMNDWKKSKGAVTIAERDVRLDALRGNDIRRDYEKYLMRNALQQSYALNLSGGSKMMSHNLSGGYDKTLNNTIYSDRDRVSMTYSTSLKLLKNLDLNGSAAYFLSHTNDQGTGTNGSFAGPRLNGASTGGNFQIYDRLVDDQGNPATIAHRYRPLYLDLLEKTYGDKLLSMRYVPLEDIKESFYRTKYQTIALNVSAGYQVMKGISLNLAYSYNKSLNNDEVFYSPDSYAVRTAINYFTDQSTLARALNPGASRSLNDNNIANQVFRGTVTIDKDWNKHTFNAFAGMDVSKNFSFFNQQNVWGYDENTLQYQNTMNTPAYNTLFGYGDRLPNSGELKFGDFQTRTVSAFANVGYTYDQRYTLTASVRNDADSQFGSGTSKWKSPYYHFGFGWNINNEHFYHWELLPILKFRATFGYNGNQNPLVSSYPQLLGASRGVRNDVIGGLNVSKFDPSSISNSLLRPERVGHLNLGLDFGFKNNRISGSFEYYDKRNKDLLSGGPVDPATGFEVVTYNIASLHGYGVDFNLNSVNIKAQKFSWNSSLLFSYNRVKVTEVYESNPRVTVLDYLNGRPYSQGHDLNRLFAFAWGGLDPETGDPMGILDGKPVRIDGEGQGIDNIIAIQNASSSSSSLKYIGSRVPVYFGALRNTFTYGRFSISPNLQFKLGYYFRKQRVVLYDQLVQGSLQPADYNARWQKPGDESRTNIPSLTFPASVDRDDFYRNSEVNVLKGDHIRLQEVNLDYSFGGKNWGKIKNPRIYVRIPTGNVILWRANKEGIDPEIADYPAPRTYGFGFSASF